MYEIESGIEIPSKVKKVKPKTEFKTELQTEFKTPYSFCRNNLVSCEELHEQLSYDPETGITKWKKRRRGRRFNTEVGYLHPNGYMTVKINYREHRLHRIIWVLMTGDWVESEIDHIDNNRSNNKWNNLRLSDRQLNGQNLKTAHKDARSKYLGVCFDSGKWRANISVNHKAYFLGHFDTEIEAHEAYLKAKRELHPANTL